ncbi:Prefoldin subunit 4 [Favolaschia claudopus]|uniref:Prefoldin subunit 4 n=1 Tax=Favolaschia claudopus TaxID=2862362 RepID=A0AAW0AAL1_9AGAR
MNSLRMLENDDDDAAEVTLEDQNRISTFSKLNARIRNLEAKLQELRQEKEALDDLSTELELADEDEPVLYDATSRLPCESSLIIIRPRYKVGETFLHMPLPRALKRLEKDQDGLSAQLSSVATTVEQYEKEMKELKVTLYAKFGSAINLDE